MITLTDVLAMSSGELIETCFYFNLMIPWMISYITVFTFTMIGIIVMEQRFEIFR